MDENKNSESPEKKYNPILQFSPSLAEDFKMYETFDYCNDRDKTHQLVNYMETGNVVKYYKVSRTEKNAIISSEQENHK